MKLKKLLVALPILSCLWGSQLVSADTVNNTNGMFQLSLDKNSQKLIKEPNDEMFFNESSLVANQTIEKSLVIKNDGKKSMKLLFHIEDTALNDSNREVTNDMLEKLSMKMVYKDDDTNKEEVIYDGNIKGVSENIILGNFDSGDSGLLTTYVTTPANISGSWLNNSVSTIWVFQGDVVDDTTNPDKPNTPTVPTKPKTGDYVKYGSVFGVSLVSGVYIIYSLAKRKKQKKRSKINI